MALELNGKVALVTGAVRRSGRAVALSLAREGASLVINTRASREEAEALRVRIEGIGRPAMTCVADVTVEDAVRAMFDSIEKRFGGVDILVNNAADRNKVPFVKMTYQQWRHIVGISLDGSFFCSRAAIPHMLRKRWGRIVNIGGVGQHLSGASFAGRAHAATAKAGLEGLTRALSTEYAGDGITVNCIVPGLIGGERSKTAGEAPNAGLLPPVGRMGTPEDVARAVHFVCLPGADYITGQIIHVNGGVFLP